MFGKWLGWLDCICLRQGSTMSLRPVWTHCVDQAGPELRGICLPLPPRAGITVSACRSGVKGKSWREYDQNRFHLILNDVMKIFKKKNTACTKMPG